MPKYPKNYKDVVYYTPGRKRRVAGSTIATNAFLVLIHKENPEATIAELRCIISDRTRFIYNPDATEVLDAYIKAGYGGYIPNWK